MLLRLVGLLALAVKHSGGTRKWETAPSQSNNFTFFDHTHKNIFQERCELLHAQKSEKNKRLSSQTPQLRYLTVDKLVESLLKTKCLQKGWWFLATWSYRSHYSHQIGFLHSRQPKLQFKATFVLPLAIISFHFAPFVLFKGQPCGMR